MACSLPTSFSLLHVGASRKLSLRQGATHPQNRRVFSLGNAVTHYTSLTVAALKTSPQNKDDSGFGHSVCKASVVAAVALSIAFNGIDIAQARPQGVNRPELLPKTFTPVIDAAGFLSEGQEGRIAKEVTNLEEETGFKLRVLAQNYPNTPGLAIKDFWKVDDSTIVFVADPSLGGNILNFNVGAAVDLSVPRSFWSRLAGKYGNMFYWQEKGEDASIEAAVSAISTCLREPPGPSACSTIQ
ncbi:hypothetical protein GOP47_0007443 [Adiantum capillus-veneris]|uniref:TPM domain-containing protein n=1 Tax=Adiantum capillus-veneris TaxID=13818 RepID=A0A9D4ZJB0_ADICA|nr:hypothetical protein GOP47_0007443 [Adiantum capillus-veneris]